MISGQKQPRQNIQLRVSDALDALCELAKQVAPNARLLRIYWYDGLLRGGRPTGEQLSLANSPFTKLRLGMVNGSGQQKGVDSLIVTDLIDLARNRAITDALLVAGDEDLRIGVQIAQTFGVQTHLVGIKPARGSQSPDLIQESDTHHEWDEAVISRFMICVAPESAPDESKAEPETSGLAQTYTPQLAQQEINLTISNLGPDVLKQYLLAFSAAPTTVPSDLDRQTLGRLGAKLSRNLDQAEVREYRKLFRERLQAECKSLE
ncbi:NYN domain-containing protein [Rhodobacter capsulatus]|uniref:NYN domain-containing protein n=1 Tax=Rhodobacter capsulatus TaxID=1061 RepID=A0A1G7CRD2_RHOCA|nr:NYN domain-containing protein [Rhodobacter capsulatus]